MTNNTLDNVEKTIKINPINFFGLGLFFALTLFNFSYLFKNVFREVLMIFYVNPYFNFWITEIVIIVFFAIITRYFLKKLIRLSFEKTSRNLIYIIVLFFVSVILKFVFHNFFIQMLQISEQIKEYNMKIIDTTSYYLLFQLFDILNYAIIIMLIYKFSKDYSTYNSLN
jgi:hypothetical protein